MKTKLLVTTTLDLPPSCISFVPSHPEKVLVGTYHLKDPGSKDGSSDVQRDGSLSLLQLTEAKIQLVHTYLFDYAILDLRFSPSDPERLAYATSNGMIHVCSFDSEKRDFILDHRVIEVAPSPDILALSLAWEPPEQRSLYSDFIAVTLSNGAISIVDSVHLTSESEPYQAHSLETWVVAWSRVTDHPALYTGGDDSALCFHRLNKAWQLGSTSDAPSPPTLCSELVRDSKIHGAGVTSIVSLCTDKDNREILLTGSYDEYARILQITPGVKRPKVLVEKRLDGGVWQLRQLGASELSEAEGNGELSITVLASFDILGKFEEHESMNYASDAQLGGFEHTIKDMTFVSTSFYDKKLCIWKLEDDSVSLPAMDM
ncbi:MAG: hypothetical protein Q9225_002983 [Loekoesia sp. 1 TL-2023]